MTLEIKINLAKPPEKAPWNFPHRCFSIAFRIKAALDVLDGVEPWGEDEATSPARFLAYRQLFDLNNAARSLLHGEEGQSPFDSALKVIDVKYKREGHELLWWERYIEGAKGGFKGTERNWSSMAQADLPWLKEEFLGHAQRLENMGVYFLRMMQATAGANLPEEHVVKTKVMPSPWTHVADVADYE